MVNGYGKQVAQTYDAFYDTKIGRSEDQVIRSLFRPFAKSAVVVDLGAGTGLIKHLCEPFIYVAVDESSQMMSDLVSSSSRIEPGHVSQVEADLNTPEGRQRVVEYSTYLGSAETVTALWALHAFHDQAVYNMAFDILTENGYALLHGNLPRRRFRAPGATGNVTDDYNPLCTAEAMKDGMIRAGFQGVRVIGCNAVPDWLSRVLPENVISRLMRATRLIPARYHYHAVVIGRKP